MIAEAVGLVALLLATLWVYSKYRHNYWASMGVQTPPVTTFFGHFFQIISNEHGRWEFDQKVYKKFGGSRFYGIYEMLAPVLVVVEPELIRNIFVKDFDHFVDRRSLKSPNKLDEAMNNMLNNETGDKWKKLRSTLTPVFTSGNLRNMFHLVCEKADALVSFSLHEASINPSVDMKFNFGRYTLDTIASCAFGIECNSLTDKTAVFPEKAQAFFNIGPFTYFKFFLVYTFPLLFKALGMRVSPPELGFFKEVADENLAARRKGIKRGDFMDFLLEVQANAKNSSNETGEVISDITILAQSILFIVAGYDTTASTIAFAAFFLSKYPEEQQRLRQELRQLVREHGDVTYQAIMEAKLLDAVIMETLRLYPPAPMLERICTRAYQIPDTNITIPRGMLLQFPIWSIHRDERHWPDPETFRPDRFMPENKAKIKSYTHLPFGSGPRNCIAMRFALLEAKVALAKLLLAAELKVAPGYEEVKLGTGLVVKPSDEGLRLILTPVKEEEKH